MAAAQQAKRMGNESFRKESYSDAISSYTEALKHDSSDYTLLSNRSAAYASLDPPLFDKALEDANEVVKRNPTWPKGHFRKGIAHRGLQQWDQAVASLSKALSLIPNGEDPELQLLLKQARECQKKTLASQSADSITDPDECKRIGNALFQESNYVDAALYYTRAYDLAIAQGRTDTGVATYLINRAACSSQTHGYKDMVDDCTTALKFDIACVKAYLRRAIAYEGLEKWQLAADDYKKVLELAPGTPNASQGLDRCRKLAGA